MSLANIRALAETRIAESRKRIRFCLDDDARVTLERAEENYRHAEAAHIANQQNADNDEDGDIRAIGSPTVQAAEDRLSQARTALEDARKIADDATLVVVFRRLNSNDYDRLVKRWVNKRGQLELEFYEALLAAAFVQAETVDMEPLDIDWPTLLNATLTSGDRDVIATEVVAFHRTPVALPPHSLLSSAKTDAPS